MSLVFVMGMHRSGTSMLTQMLSIAGLSIGETYDLMHSHPDDNPSGYWENRHAKSLNEEILEILGGSWRQVPQLPSGWETEPRFNLIIRRMQGLYNQSDSITTVFKDPRNTITYPLWRRAFPDMRVIVCIRNPVEVAHSLNTGLSKTRNFVFEEAIALWQRYYEIILGTLDPDDAVWTHYETYFYDPSQELQRVLTHIGYMADSLIIEKAIALVDTSLKHHFIPHELIHANYPSPVVAQYYSYLCSLCGPYFQTLLQDISKQYTTARYYLQTTAGIDAKELIVTQGKLAETKNTLQTLQQQMQQVVQRHEQTIAANEADAKRQDEQVATLKEQLDEASKKLAARVAQFQQQLEIQDAHNQQLQDQLIVQAKENEELKTKWQDQQGSLSQQSMLITEYSEMLEQQQQSLVTLETLIHHQQEVLEQQAATIREQQSKLSRRKGQLKQQKEILAQRDKQIAQYHDQISQYIATSEKQKSELSARNKEIAKLKQSLSDSQTQVQSLKNQIKELEIARIEPKRSAPMRENRLLNLIRWTITLQLPSRIWSYLQRRRHLKLIKQSGLFDEAWYLKQYPDVAQEEMNPVEHYLWYGAGEGRNPHPLFDTLWYLQQNPDVAANGINPLVHYIRFGANERRDPNALFDTDWYLSQNQELAPQPQNPLLHYLHTGSKQHLTPNSNFDLMYRAGFASGQDNPLVEFTSKYGLNTETLYQAFVAKHGIPKETKYYALSEPEIVKNNIAGYARTRKKGSRIAVYTAIVDNYDILKIPENPSPELDYYCFSNTPQPTYGIYTILPIDFFGDDATRTARFIKTHPYLYFSEYDLVIWVDASIVLQANIMNFVNKFLATDQLVASVRHPLRNTIYEEAQECIVLNKDDKQVIQQQVAAYQAKGYRQSTLLIETNLLMIKLQDKRSHQFLQTWWNEIKKHSKRDQLSVNYVLDKHQLSVHHLFYAGFSVRDFPGFLLVTHSGKIGEPNYSSASIDSSLTLIDPYQGSSYFAEKYSRLKLYEKLSVDIIICVHNALDEVRCCLQAVVSTRSSHHRIVIIDDGSDNETCAYLVRFSQEQDNVIVQRNEIPERYTKAVNQGLKLSTADFVILLNSDTIVSRDWIEKLADAVFSTSQAGIVGPLSNAASHQSIPNHTSSQNQTAINPLPDGFTIEDMNRFCEQLTRTKILPRVPLVHGFCMGIRREVIDTIGYMGEQHFPQGFGEENDYCFRAADAGFSLVIATHTYVYHAKTKSYTVDQRAQITKESSQVLHSLYGKERVHRAINAMNMNPILSEIRRKAADLY